MISGGDERYACPGVVPDGGGAFACGLWLGHTGPCTPHVGDYLPPPFLHPLDARLVPLRLRSRCNVVCPNGHGGRERRAYSFLWGEHLAWDAPTYVVEGPVAAFRHCEAGEWLGPEIEAVWRFEPCGCEFRQIVESDGA